MLHKHVIKHVIKHLNVSCSCSSNQHTDHSAAVNRSFEVMLRSGCEVKICHVENSVQRVHILFCATVSFLLHNFTTIHLKRLEERGLGAS